MWYFLYEYFTNYSKVNNYHKKLVSFKYCIKSTKISNVKHLERYIPLLISY